MLSFRKITEGATLPVNVMVMERSRRSPSSPSSACARVSYGPTPYIEAMEALQKKAGKVLA